MKVRTQIFFIFFLIKGVFTFAQNYGINTNNPQATLDVRGNARFGGQNNFQLYDSLSGKITWNNSRLFLPTSQQLIQHSNSAEGFFYNNSTLEYRNQNGDAVFSTNWSTSVGYFRGNLGIGTMNPAMKLHIQQGLSGVSPNYGNIILENNINNYLSFYTPDNFQSAVIFNRTSQPNSGGIYYNSVSNPNGLSLQANGATRMRLANNGNVAIGDLVPRAKLHVLDSSFGFSGSYSPGLTLEGNGNRYINFILPPGSLNAIQFRSDLPQAGFVYDSPATPNGLQFRTNGFHSRMLIAGNGYVGIGNINPAYILDVNERMRIQAAAPTLSAGIWLNNNANAEAAFIGLEDDTHVGFYGTGSSWRFSMNTNIGALKVNGTDGIAGQVITSGGNASADWKSVTKSMYDNMVMKVQIGEMPSTAGSLKEIPDLIHTFTIPGNGKVVLTTTLNTETTGCFLCGSSRLFVEIQLDGVVIQDFSTDIGNGRSKIFMTDYVFPVTSGTHTVRLLASSIGPDVRLWGNTSTFKSNMILEIIPE